MKIVSCFFEISADPTSSVTLKMPEVVHIDLFLMSEYVWSGSITEKTLYFKVCVYVEIKVRDYIPWRGTRAEVSERQ